MRLRFRTPWFLHKNESPTENDVHSVDPSAVNPFERKKLKAACALNMCMVSLSQIVDYQNLEILKMEYDSILNNLNLEKIVKDEPLLKAVQAIMDACHFYILHAKDKEMLKKKQQARLKGALGNALGGGNVIAVLGSGNPWAIAAGAAAMIGVAAVNYKSQRDKAKLENELDEWQLERSALEQLHNLRRTLFETAWRFAEKYNYPDEYRLTEKQIAIYNDIIKNPDPQTRYESLWLIRDNFRAYPIFWYYLGRAALETSDAFRPDSAEGAGKRQLAYGNGDVVLCGEYRKKAFDAYETFKKCHLGNELMREDLVAASAYLDHAQLCDPSQPQQLLQILEDVNQAYKIASMDVDVVQSCAFRYLQLFEKIDQLKNVVITNVSDVAQEIEAIPQRAVECLKFLMDRDYNPEVNGRALSVLLKKLGNKSEYAILKSVTSRRCPFVYLRLLPWDNLSFKQDWSRFLYGVGLKRSAFNLFYGLTWMQYKDFFCALYEAKIRHSYMPLKAFREFLKSEYNGKWESNLHNPKGTLSEFAEGEDEDSDADAEEKIEEKIAPSSSSPEGLDDDKDSFDGFMRVLDVALDTAETINNPVWKIAEKAWCAHQKKEKMKADESLTGMMLNLLDDSFERVAWKLFLGTRASEFEPTEFENREKKLFSTLIVEAKAKAEAFAEAFGEDATIKGTEFDLETIKKDRCEPVAFRSIVSIERKSERLRMEIQELIGDGHRFWYPDPKFTASTRLADSEATKSEIDAVKPIREKVTEFAAEVRDQINEHQESLTPAVLDDFANHGGLADL